MYIAQHAADLNLLFKSTTNADITFGSETVPEWAGLTTYAINKIVSYNGVLYKSLQSINANKQPDTETDWWQELQTGGGNASLFDVTQLEGYGLKAEATGSDFTDISSMLIPFNGNTGAMKIYTGAAWWENNGVGITSPIGNDVTNQVDGDVKFTFHGGATWGTTIDKYVNVPTGYYWICFPGTNGTSVKFWYDRELCFSKMTGRTADVYIDQAGCLWLGDPTTTGDFICGPTFEDAHGKNIDNIHYRHDDANYPGGYTIINSIVPVLCTEDEVRLYIDGQYSIFNYIGGAGSATPRLNDGNWEPWGTPTTYNTASPAYLAVSYGAGYPWDDFLDAPSGMYSFNLPYTDATNLIEGTKVPFYYDKVKWEKAFKGTIADIYFDQIGQVWKGNPEADGEYVCGPYDASVESFFDPRVTSLENAETPAAYVNGNDQDLNWVTAAANIPATTIPAQDNSVQPRMEFWVGSNKWFQDTNIGVPGDTVIWYYANPVLTWGSVYFRTNNGTQAWATFADSTHNGLKTITFATGATVKYYYDSNAWTTALYGQVVEIHIAQNGDVFKGSIAPENLVVDHNGNWGPAAINAALALKANKTNVLEKDNTTSFTPTTDYHPATKKFVDDTISGLPAASDEKASVSANDTTPGYLNGKLVQGTGITLTENNDAGNETLTIAATASGGGAAGQDGTILAGNTEVTVKFLAKQIATDGDKATVSAVGANGGQRQVFIKTAPVDNGADIDVVVGIDSSYTEDIVVHVVLAKE